MNLETDPITVLELLDERPVWEDIPASVFPRDSNWGVLYAPALFIEDAAEAELYLRHLVIYALHYAQKRRPELRRLTVKEAFEKIRLDLGVWAGGIDVQHGPFAQLQPDGEYLIKPCRLARDHVKRLYNAEDPAEYPTPQSILDAVEFKRIKAKKRRGETPWTVVPLIPVKQPE